MSSPAGFVLVAVVLAGALLLDELADTRSRNRCYRAGAGIVLVSSLALV